MIDIEQRITAAIERITSGNAPMRVPADETDPDLVLADCLAEIRRLRAALSARQPAYVQGCDELRARTEGERAAYMEGLEEGKKIAARQPVGEPVARVNAEGFIVETGLLLSPGTNLYADPREHPQSAESSERAGFCIMGVCATCQGYGHTEGEQRPKCKGIGIIESPAVQPHAQAVVDEVTDAMVDKAWTRFEAALHADDGDTPEDRVLSETIDQRDRYHEMADELAGHIARIIGVDIGEHSSANCPWQNAIEAATEYKPAQAVDLGQFRDLAEFALRNAKLHNCWEKREALARELLDLIGSRDPRHG